MVLQSYYYSRGGRRAASSASLPSRPFYLTKISASHIAKRHFEAAISAAETANLDVDTVCRALLGNDDLPLG